MAFFSSAIGVLQTLVIALGAGLAIWGVINLLEGYGNDKRAAASPWSASCWSPCFPDCSANIPITNPGRPRNAASHERRATH